MLASIVDRAAAPVATVLVNGTLPKDVMNLGNIIGPFFLAHCFNWALYGVLVLQVYIYSLRFPEDQNRYFKWLVAIVFILDTISMSFATHAGWTVLVSHWGDINIFHELDWTWASVPVSSGIVSGIVQSFFVWRIWKLSRSFVMPFIIALVILVQVAFAFKTGAIAYHVRNFQYTRGLLPAFWLGGSMLADALISITITRILWTARTGFVDADSFIMRLIRLSVEAAAIPTISAVIKLILIYSAHGTEHLVFCVLLARLYSNSLLAMLNCRDPLFGGGSRRSSAPISTRRGSGYPRSSNHISIKLRPLSDSANSSKTEADPYPGVDDWDRKAPISPPPSANGPRDLERGSDYPYRTSQVTFEDDTSTIGNTKRNSADLVAFPPPSHSF